MAFEEDIRTQILAAGVSNGSSIFIGNVRKPGNGIPEKAIFITQTGGYAPNEFLGAGAFGPYRRVTVQVRVRGEVHDFQVGRDLANSTWDALQAPTISGYVRVVNLQSAPAYAGLDDTEHPEWFFNVLMEKKE